VLVRFDDDEAPEGHTAPESGLENTSLHRTSGGIDGLTEDELEEAGRVFIPLTWSWLEEGELYTASDPEWQEFVSISKDRKKLQELRGMLGGGEC
jgi:hypothetical protein